MVIGTMKKKKVIIGAVIVVFFFIAILARPSIIGLGVYEDNETLTDLLEDQEPVKTVESLQLDLDAAEQSLSLYKELNDQLQKELKDNSDILTDALVSKAVLESTQSNYETTISLLQERLDEKTAQLEDNEANILSSEQTNTDELNKLSEELEILQEDYGLLAENTAKNICCKQRIDNSRINSYDVTNNKIICLEDGETSLSC